MIHIEGQFYLSDDLTKLNLLTAEGEYLPFRIKAKRDNSGWLILPDNNRQFKPDQLEAIEAFLASGGANRGRNIAMKGLRDE